MRNIKSYMNEESNERITPTFFKALRLGINDLFEVIERLNPNSEIFPILEKEISDEEFETIIKDKYMDIFQEISRRAFMHSIDINNCKKISR